jgi:hypothetical protein
MSPMARVLALWSATTHICRSMLHHARTVQRLCEGARDSGTHTLPTRTRMSVGLFRLVGETVCLIVQVHRWSARRHCLAGGWG